MKPIDAIRDLDAAASVCTSELRTDDKQPTLCLRFNTAKERQAFQEAIASCSSFLRQTDAVEEEEIRPGCTGAGGGSVGPFSYGTGGGERVIRGTNSLT